MILPILQLPSYKEEDVFGLSGKECYHYLNITVWLLHSLATVIREETKITAPWRVLRGYTVHQNHTSMDLDSEDRRGEYYLVKKASPLL